MIDDLGKSLILILNKTDMAPPSLVVAWKHYFQEFYPKIHVVCFTSYPRDPAEEQDPSAGIIKLGTCAVKTPINVFVYFRKKKLPTKERSDNLSKSEIV